MVKTIPKDQLQHVIVENHQVQLTGRICESPTSASYSTLFDRIVTGNPQEETEDTAPPPAKAPKLSMSYRQAVASSATTTTTTPTATVHDDDLEKLLAQMQEKFGNVTPIKASELEEKFQLQVGELAKQIDARFETVSNKIDSSIKIILHEQHDLRRSVTGAIEYNYGALASLGSQMQANMTIMQENMVMQLKGETSTSRKHGIHA